MSEEPKSYRMGLMDDDHMYLTAREAASIFISMNDKKFIMIKGRVLAVHQIKNIKPLNREDAQSRLGLSVEEYKNLPKMEDFLKDNQDVKLIS